jgi:pimeloyl-ACP methyl ester carboxylesterase
MILGHKIIGAGPEKVLIIHDWFSDCTSYDQVLPYMDTEKFTYILVDLRGYGRSKEIQGRYDLEETVEDLEFLADNFELENFHIISHSMSGIIAQKLLLLMPKKIKSIIAITPVTSRGCSTEKEAFNFLEDGADRNDEAACQIVGNMTSNKLTDKFSKFKVRKWRETTASMARIAYLSMFVETNFIAEMKNFNTPLLVILGKNDAEDFREKTIKENLLRFFPNSILKIINDSGHFPMQETPILLASYLNEFLKENSV